MPSGCRNQFVTKTQYLCLYNLTQKGAKNVLCLTKKITKFLTWYRYTEKFKKQGKLKPNKIVVSNFYDIALFQLLKNFT